MSRLALGALVGLASLCACGTPVVGPQPTRPAIERAWYARTPGFTPVDSLRPELAWEAVEDVPGAEDVTYELRVWERRRGDVGPLVYRRLELPEPVHRVEHPLFPDTRYLWSVRAHFRLDGEHRVTPWGQFGVPITGFTVPNRSCFRFRTPPAVEDAAAAVDAG